MEKIRPITSKMEEAFSLTKLQLLDDRNWGSIRKDDFCGGEEGRSQCDLCTYLSAKDSYSSTDDICFISSHPYVSLTSSTSSSGIILCDSLSLPYLTSFAVEELLKDSLFPYHEVVYAYTCGNTFTTIESEMDYKSVDELNMTPTLGLNICRNLFALFQELKKIEYTHGNYDYNSIKFSDEGKCMITYFADSSFCREGITHMTFADYTKTLGKGSYHSERYAEDFCLFLLSLLNSRNFNSCVADSCTKRLIAMARKADYRDVADRVPKLLKSRS